MVISLKPITKNALSANSDCIKQQECLGLDCFGCMAKSSVTTMVEYFAPVFNGVLPPFGGAKVMFNAVLKPPVHLW